MNLKLFKTYFCIKNFKLKLLLCLSPGVLTLGRRKAVNMFLLRLFLVSSRHQAVGLTGRQPDDMSYMPCLMA